MKIVKLNGRYKMFREQGHTVALRFNGWSKLIAPYERACRERLGSQYKNYSWSGHFGTRSGRNDVRPYWISFRNEADLTLVLLCADLTK